MIESMIAVAVAAAAAAAAANVADQRA